MTNKLKFLLSSLIILEGYTTASEVYYSEVYYTAKTFNPFEYGKIDKQIEQEANNNSTVQDEINKNNPCLSLLYYKYLEQLCKQGKINLDKNGNIIEDEKFFDEIKFQNVRMLHLLHVTHFIALNKNGKMVNPLYDHMYDCNCRCYNYRILDDLSEELKTCFYEQKVDLYCKIPDVDTMLSSYEKIIFDMFTDYELLPEEKLGAGTISTCGEFEYEIFEFANSIKFPESQSILSIKNLKKEYPEVITMTSDKDDITVKELETYLKNKIYIIDINYIISILTYRNNRNKIKQETINYHSKITSIIKCFHKLLENDFKVPKEDISKYCDDGHMLSDDFLDGLENFYKDSDGNILIKDEEKQNNLLYSNYVSELIKPLASESKKNLYSLIKDKNFLEFVNDSYQTFSDLKTKIQQIISQYELYRLINCDRPYSSKLPDNVLYEIQKLLPNKQVENISLEYVLNYCMNTISEVGTLQLCNVIQQCITKYKNNNDENELKNNIKYKVIKIYHDLIPLKELAIKLLQKCIDNHVIISRYSYNGIKDDEKKLYYNLLRTDMHKLIKVIKEKIEKLKNSKVEIYRDQAKHELEPFLLPTLLKLREAREKVIPQLGSELEKFAEKYNIPLSEEHNKIEQNNIDDE